MTFITCADASERTGMSVRRIQQMCNEIVYSLHQKGPGRPSSGQIAVLTKENDYIRESEVFEAPPE